jgi:hypothetical protein
MATTGNVSEMSDRASATESTAPVASAATRSTTRGVTRAATWPLVAATTGNGTNRPSSQPSTTTAAAPATSSSRHRRRFPASASTTAGTIPRIGVISGATIIAPITVAVESLTTPADAITAASTSSSQYRLTRRLRSAPSKKTWSRIRPISSWVTPIINLPPAAVR